MHCVLAALRFRVSTRLAAVAAAFVLFAVISCGDDTTSPGNTGGGNSPLGRLVVTVSGLPAGLAAAIDVVGAVDSFRVTTTTTLDSLPPGEWDLSALDVLDPVLPVAWQPTLSTSRVTVSAGQTASVTVTYDSVSTVVRLELKTGDGYNGVLAEWNAILLQPVYNGASFVADPCGSGWGGGFDMKQGVGRVTADTMGSHISVNFNAAIPATRTIGISWSGSVAPPPSQGNANARVQFNELPYNYFYGELFNPRGDSLLVTMSSSAVVRLITPPGGTTGVGRGGATASVDILDCQQRVFFQDLYRLSSSVGGDTLSAANSASFRTSATHLLLRIHMSGTLIGRYDSRAGLSYLGSGSGRLLIGVNKITP